MKKFFSAIGKIFKKFFNKIGKMFKKFFVLISNKWLLKGTTTCILIALVIACYIGINWAAEQIKISDWDFTESKLHSLSVETKNKLATLENDVTIQVINVKDEYYTDYYGNSVVDGSYVKEYVEKYSNASKKVKIEIIDDLDSRVDLQTEYNITTEDALIVVESGENKKTISLEDLYSIDYTTYEYTDSTEEAITNAITAVTIKEKPHIYVYTGKTYFEPEETLAVILYQLRDEANEIDQLNILTTGEVPEDCDCLVITTLKQDLSELERDKILEYINRGGEILLLSSQNVLKVDTPNFNQVLAQYGVSLESGIILEQDSSKILAGSPSMALADVDVDFLNDIGMSLELFIVNAGNIKFDDENKLEESGVTYEVIAKTTEKSFVRTDTSITSSSKTDKDSEEGVCTVGALVTKTISEDKTSKLIVYSSEYMASSFGYNVYGVYTLYPILEANNEDIILNSIYYLCEREDTILIRKDTNAEVESYTVTEQEDVIIKTIIFVVPILIIAIGIAVWIFRRRKF